MKASKTIAYTEGGTVIVSFSRPNHAQSGLWRCERFLTGAKEPTAWAETARPEAGSHVAALRRVIHEIDPQWFNLGDEDEAAFLAGQLVERERI